MAKDATLGDGQTAHDEKVAIEPQMPSHQEGLKTDEPIPAATGRRKSAALNIVQNPLTVSHRRLRATARTPAQRALFTPFARRALH